MTPWVRTPATPAVSAWFVSQIKAAVFSVSLAILAVALSWWTGTAGLRPSRQVGKLLHEDVGKRLSSLDLHSLQSLGIEAQKPKHRGRDLPRRNGTRLSEGCPLGV